MINMEDEPLEPRDLEIRYERFPWIELTAIVLMLALVVVI